MRAAERLLGGGGARKGRVATQNPRAGKRLAWGAKVKVTLRRASR